MKNRLTAFLLSVVLCLSVVGTTYAAELTQVTDRVEFELKEENSKVTVTVSGLESGTQYEGWTLTLQRNGGTWETIDYFNPLPSGTKWRKTFTISSFDTETDKMQLNMPDLGIYQPYSNEPEKEQAAQPVITGVTPFASSTTVTITCATEGADIYYTTNGGTPTTASAKYTAPFTLSATTTVKAIAVKAGMLDSEVSSKTFTKSGGSSQPVGGSSAGGSDSESSKVTVIRSPNGSVTYRPASPKAGETVTLTVRPNSGFVLDSLTVTTRSGRTVAVTKVDDTTYTFVMPEGRVEVKPVFKAAAAAPTASFSDVPSSHTFYDDISWVAARGFMSGYADGTFRPSANTTRQALWMVLARIDGANPSNMSAARSWAISSGVSDGSNPGGAMTRQQMVTMLYRYAQMKGYQTTGGISLSSFSDASSVAAYAQDAMSWAVGSGIMQGTGNGALNPNGTATRAHFAAFLHRFCISAGIG